jgi:hypothetical protein
MWNKVTFFKKKKHPLRVGAMEKNQAQRGARPQKGS